MKLIRIDWTDATLILRSLTLRNGHWGWGGGALELVSGAKVQVVLCLLQGNRARTNNAVIGGGGIYVTGESTTLDVFGSIFVGNTQAKDGPGKDIFNNADQPGAVEVYNSCPEGLSTIVASQGEPKEAPSEDPQESTCF